MVTELPPMPAVPRGAIARLNAAGYEAFAVGGCVRDTLLGLTPKDWDIATAALPQEAERVFADCRVVETGLQHGTVTVLFGGQPLEITTYRVDGTYADGRHPDGVTFTRSLPEDLKRRDFTVNAMAWHPESGLFDPFDGKTDLRNGILRCVGDAPRRFQEDALRILRALRFAATYGFVIEKDTADAVHALADRLHMVSAERVREELFKLICGRWAFRVLREFPDVLPFENGAALETAPDDFCCRLALLRVTADRLRALKTDTATVRRTERLSAGLLLPLSCERLTLLQALGLLGERDLRMILSVRGCGEEIWAALAALLAEDPCYTLRQLAVNGNDLTAMGLCGAAVGGMLQKLLLAVMRGDCPNERAALLRLAKRNIEKSTFG